MEGIEVVNLKSLRMGSYFTLKDIREPKQNQVYIKGKYDRNSKSFSCVKFSDINSERLIKADKLVYVGFTF